MSQELVQHNLLLQQYRLGNLNIQTWEPAILKEQDTELSVDWPGDLQMPEHFTVYSKKVSVAAAGKLAAAANNRW